MDEPFSGLDSLNARLLLSRPPTKMQGLKKGVGLGKAKPKPKADPKKQKGTSRRREDLKLKILKILKTLKY